MMGFGGMSSNVPFGVDQAVLYYWHCLVPVVGQNLLENGLP